MPYRRLVELRQARLNRLVKEREAEDQRIKEQQNNMTRDKILRK